MLIHSSVAGVTCVRRALRPQTERGPLSDPGTIDVHRSFHNNDTPSLDSCGALRLLRKTAGFGGKKFRQTDPT